MTMKQKLISLPDKLMNDAKTIAKGKEITVMALIRRALEEYVLKNKNPG